MQSVYAMLQSKDDNLPKEEKFLYNSIEKMYELYAIILRLLVEVRNMEKDHIELSSKKRFATKEELSPNTKFIDNEVFKQFFESISLNEFIETNKLNCWYLHEDYVKDILREIKESDILSRLDLTKEKYFVVSAHREENISSDANFTNLMQSLKLTNFFLINFTFNKDLRGIYHLKTSNSTIFIHIY